MYAGGALYLDTILDCLRNLARTLTPDTTHYVVEALARAAMEAGAVLFWLLQPGIGARLRVARFWLIRASGAGLQVSHARFPKPSQPARMRQRQGVVRQRAGRAG